MTPTQIDLVRQVAAAVRASSLDLGAAVLARLPWPVEGPPPQALALCPSLGRLVADLDRVGALLDGMAPLAQALGPLHPSSADLATLGTALDAVLREGLAGDDYTDEHAAACRLAWRLLTELLQQRPRQLDGGVSSGWSSTRSQVPSG